MPRSAALPFLLKRGSQVFSGSGMTTTRETVHGLLRLENDQLRIQWRVGRKTEHLDSEMRTDKEVEPVREIVVPLRGVAGAVVQRRWWDFLLGPRLALTAADLSAFEGLAGHGGLSLDHPAELVLRLRRSDRLAAEEFGAELALAIAEDAVSGAAGRPALADHASPAPVSPAASQPPRLPDGD
jgi:hypothetical protein